MAVQIVIALSSILFFVEIFLEVDLFIYIVGGYVISFAALLVMLIGGISIRKWQKEWLKPHGHRSNWKNEGLFIIWLTLSIAVIGCEILTDVTFRHTSKFERDWNKLVFSAFIV